MTYCSFCSYFVVFFFLSCPLPDSIFEYFSWSYMWLLIWHFHWQAPSRQLYILMGLRCIIVRAHQIDFQRIHMYSCTFSCYPSFTIFTFVLAPPVLSLFIVFHMVHGSFPPNGGNPSGGTDISACSYSLHLRSWDWAEGVGSNLYQK